MRDASPSHSPPRALRWWSAANLSLLSRRITGGCDAWAARWSLAIDAADCFNAHEAPDAPTAWHAWQGRAGSHRPWCWTSTPADTPAGWLAVTLFGRAHERSIAAEVAARAWTEFGDDLARLFGEAPGLDMPAVGPLPASGPWSGGVAVRLRCRGADTSDLWMHIDADSVAALLRDAPHRAAPPLTQKAPTPVLHALAPRPLTIRVELEAPVIDIGTLQSLRIGDVLTLPHRLDQPLHLRPDGQGDALSCAAYLGSRDGHRAVELVPLRDQ
jgi:hypothetical protein